MYSKGAWLIPHVPRPSLESNGFKVGKLNNFGKVKEAVYDLKAFSKLNFSPAKFRLNVFILSIILKAVISQRLLKLHQLKGITAFILLLKYLI